MRANQVDTTQLRRKVCIQPGAAPKGRLGKAVLWTQRLPHYWQRCPIHCRFSFSHLGSIRLYHNEVLNSEGERLVVTLSKCLDPEALCEIRIDKVVKRGTQRKRTLTSIPEHQKTNSPRLNEEDTMSPRDYKTNKIDHLPINESKSESYLPSSSNNIAQRKG